MSSTTRPARSAPPNLKPSERLSVGSRSIRSIFVELLHARLGLPRLRRLVAEALDEALHAGDLRLLLLDLLAELDLARRRLAAPGVPRAGEEARAPGLELQDGRSHRLQEPAVVSHEDHRRVELGEVLLEPLERGDVEVVRGLVQQQQVRVARERARERRAGELAAGEGRELPVELLVGEAEAVERAQRAGAPVPAAGVLQARLRARVALEQRAVVGALRHLALEPAQVLLERDEVAAARQDVVAQGEIALAGRALVVQRHPRALLEAPAPRRRSRSRPDSIRSSVVLPAPLRPASVMRSPRSSLNETPLNRGFPAMSLSSALAITTAMSGSRLRGARKVQGLDQGMSPM